MQMTEEKESVLRNYLKIVKDRLNSTTQELLRITLDQDVEASERL